MAPIVHRSAESSFSAHSLNSQSRLPVDMGDLCSALAEICREQHDQEVDYVELRVSPRRLITQGTAWHDLLDAIHKVVAAVESPIVRCIMLLNRDSDEQFIRQAESIVRDGSLPASFVGVDLAGDERTYPDVRPFRGFFDAARSVGLGLTAHAGEFGGPEHIWRALDDLGVQRIGHGVTAANSRTLLRRLASEHVLLELSLTSNAVLGAIQEISNHPLSTLLDYQVPIAFNTDTPINTGRTLEEEIAMAASAFKLGADELWRLQAAAMAHAFEPHLARRAHNPA